MASFLLRSFFFLLAMMSCQSLAVSEEPVTLKAQALAAENYEQVLPPVRVGEKTYYVQTFFKANWYRAIQFCRLIGMELASINNKNENDQLLAALASTYGDKLHFWTSGNDLAKSGNFFWLSTGANFNYKNWRKGEPNNTKGDEHCVEIVKSNISDNPLQWNDIACSAEMYLICEKLK